jgi:hypothetical protein
MGDDGHSSRRWHRQWPTTVSSPLRRPWLSLSSAGSHQLVTGWLAGASAAFVAGWSVLIVTALVTDRGSTDDDWEPGRIAACARFVTLARSSARSGAGVGRRCNPHAVQIFVRPSLARSLCSHGAWTGGGGTSGRHSDLSVMDSSVARDAVISERVGAIRAGCRVRSSLATLAFNGPTHRGRGQLVLSRQTPSDRAPQGRVSSCLCS